MLLIVLVCELMLDFRRILCTDYAQDSGAAC
jgi:hypothetical protein